MKLPILFIFAILLPSSLSAEEWFKIHFKILNSRGHAIPHDDAKAAERKDIDILTLPSITKAPGEELEIYIYRELFPESVTKEGFTPDRIGTQLAVTPSLVDGKIAFTAILTLSKLIDKKAEGGRFQTEVESRVIYLSAIQNDGEEGWFDLAESNEGETHEKTTVMIRLSLIDQKDKP